VFTGIVEEIGHIQRIAQLPKAREIYIFAQRILDDLKAEDSVNVNGVCLTATHVNPTTFTVTAVAETLDRSTLNQLRQGDAINLERALRLGDRLGGHFVQGHVDGIGQVESIQKRGVETHIRIAIPKQLCKYVVEKGSITVDGVNLTVAAVDGVHIQIAVIPYTVEQTTVGRLKSRSHVNIEVDILSKYVERFLKNNEPDTSGLNADRLRSLGF